MAVTRHDVAQADLCRDQGTAHKVHHRQGVPPQRHLEPKKLPPMAQWPHGHNRLGSLQRHSFVGQEPLVDKWSWQSYSDCGFQRIARDSIQLCFKVSVSFLAMLMARLVVCPDFAFPSQTTTSEPSCETCGEGCDATTTSHHVNLQAKVPAKRGPYWGERTFTFRTFRISAHCLPIAYMNCYLELMHKISHTLCITSLCWVNNWRTCNQHAASAIWTQTLLWDTWAVQFAGNHLMMWHICGISRAFDKRNLRFWQHECSLRRIYLMFRAKALHLEQGSGMTGLSKHRKQPCKAEMWSTKSKHL